MWKGTFLYTECVFDDAFCHRMTARSVYDWAQEKPIESYIIVKEQSMPKQFGNHRQRMNL